MITDYTLPPTITTTTVIINTTITTITITLLYYSLQLLYTTTAIINITTTTTTTTISTTTYYKPYYQIPELTTHYQTNTTVVLSSGKSPWINKIGKITYVIYCLYSLSYILYGISRNPRVFRKNRLESPRKLSSIIMVFMVNIYILWLSSLNYIIRILEGIIYFCIISEYNDILISESIQKIRLFEWIIINLVLGVFKEFQYDNIQYELVVKFIILFMIYIYYIITISEVKSSVCILERPQNPRAFEDYEYDYLNIMRNHIIRREDSDSSAVSEVLTDPSCQKHSDQSGFQVEINIRYKLDIIDPKSDQFIPEISADPSCQLWKTILEAVIFDPGIMDLWIIIANVSVSDSQNVFADQSCSLDTEAGKIVMVSNPRKLDFILERFSGRRKTDWIINIWVLLLWFTWHLGVGLAGGHLEDSCVIIAGNMEEETKFMILNSGVVMVTLLIHIFRLLTLDLMIKRPVLELKDNALIVLASNLRDTFYGIVLIGNDKNDDNILQTVGEENSRNKINIICMTYDEYMNEIGCIDENIIIDNLKLLSNNPDYLEADARYEIDTMIGNPRQIFGQPELNISKDKIVRKQQPESQVNGNISRNVFSALLIIFIFTKSLEIFKIFERCCTGSKRCPEIFTFISITTVILLLIMNNGFQSSINNNTPKSPLGDININNKIWHGSLGLVLTYGIGNACVPNIPGSEISRNPRNPLLYQQRDRAETLKNVVLDIVPIHDALTEILVFVIYCFCCTLAEIYCTLFEVYWFIIMILFGQKLEKEARIILGKNKINIHSWYDYGYDILIDGIRLDIILLSINGRIDSGNQLLNQQGCGVDAVSIVPEGKDFMFKLLIEIAFGVMFINFDMVKNQSRTTFQYLIATFWFLMETFWILLTNRVVNTDVNPRVKNQNINDKLIDCKDLRLSRAIRICDKDDDNEIKLEYGSKLYCLNDGVNINVPVSIKIQMYQEFVVYGHLLLIILILSKFINSNTSPIYSIIIVFIGTSLAMMAIMIEDDITLIINISRGILQSGNGNHITRHDPAELIEPSNIRHSQINMEQLVVSKIYYTHRQQRQQVVEVVLVLNIIGKIDNICLLRVYDIFKIIFIVDIMILCGISILVIILLHRNGSSGFGNDLIFEKNNYDQLADVVEPIIEQEFGDDFIVDGENGNSNLFVLISSFFVLIPTFSTSIVPFLALIATFFVSIILVTICITLASPMVLRFRINERNELEKLIEIDRREQKERTSKFGIILCDINGVDKLKKFIPPVMVNTDVDGTKCGIAPEIQNVKEGKDFLIKVLIIIGIIILFMTSCYLQRFHSIHRMIFNFVTNIETVWLDRMIYVVLIELETSELDRVTDDENDNDYLQKMWWSLQNYIRIILLLYAIFVRLLLWKENELLLNSGNEITNDKKSNELNKNRNLIDTCGEAGGDTCVLKIWLLLEFIIVLLLSNHSIEIKDDIKLKENKEESSNYLHITKDKIKHINGIELSITVSPTNLKADTIICNTRLFCVINCTPQQYSILYSCVQLEYKSYLVSYMESFVFEFSGNKLLIENKTFMSRTAKAAILIEREETPIVFDSCSEQVLVSADSALETNEFILLVLFIIFNSLLIHIFQLIITRKLSITLTSPIRLIYLLYENNIDSIEIGVIHCIFYCWYSNNSYCISTCI